MRALFANESFLMLLMINMTAAVGMNLVYVTGQLNLGQAGFMAVGAYTTAILDTLGWPLSASLAAGATVAGLVALPVAFGATRVRGVYLIMGTMAVGEVVRIAISNIDAAGGLQGFSGHGPIALIQVVLVFALVLVGATVVMSSPLGLQMRSIFDDEDAAAAAGVATRRTKIVAVVMSAAAVAVAGGLLAKFFLFIAPRNFGILLSFQIVLFTLIGGVHSLIGAVTGAFSVTVLLDFLRSVRDIEWVPSSLHFLAGWRLVVYGALVMVVMAVLPEGLISRRTALRLAGPFRRALRRRRGARSGSGREAPANRSDQVTVLALERIGHRFDGLAAVDDVSFTVGRGEILSLIGANGAGKTTLIDVVAGRYRCQTGRIVLEGRDLTGVRADLRTRAGIVRTFQTTRVFAHLTVEETVRLGVHAAGTRPGPSLDEVLHMIGLSHRRDVLPSGLTLAERRWLEIGRALASAPRILFLDEPSVGMNEAERAELADLLRGIPSLDVALVLVDHNLDLALSVAERVVVLDFGRLLTAGEPREVLTDTRVREAYLGGVAPDLDSRLEGHAKGSA